MFYYLNLQNSQEHPEYVRMEFPDQSLGRPQAPMEHGELILFIKLILLPTMDLKK